MTLPSWARPATAWSRNRSCSGVSSAGLAGSRPKARPNAARTLRAWPRVEQVHGGEVVPFDDADLQVVHEPGRGHAEVVADQDQALHVLAVALPQGLDQLGVLFRPLGVQPLLELVEHQQDLGAVRRDRIHAVSDPDARAAAARRGSRSSPRLSGSSGQRLRRPLSSRASVSSGVAST